MNAARRMSIIEELIEASPPGESYKKAAERSLSNLTDAELEEMYGRVQAVREHGRSVTKVDPNLTAAREALRGKRKAAYARIAKVANAARARQNAVKSVAKELEQRNAVGVPASIGHLEPLQSSVRTWNVFEHDSHDRLVVELKSIILRWMKEAGNSFLPGHNYEPLEALFKGPLEAECHQYLRYAIDQVGLGALNLLRSHVDTGNVGAVEAGPAGYASWLMSDPTAIGGLALPTLVTSIAKALPETRAIDGLARLKVFAREYGADAIVSLAGGGRIVGDFIADVSGVDGTRCWTIERYRQGMRFVGDYQSLVGFKKILIVDDVVQTGDTLRKAHMKVTSYAKKSEVRVMALVSSKAARDRLSEEGLEHAFVPNIATVDQDIDLPWSRTGGYERTRVNHVFGAGTNSEPVKIAVTQLRRISSDLQASD